FSQSGLQPVQRLQAVTLRQKEIGGSRKCLDASQPLEVFPKPDAFTLDQLHCGFFMSAIVEARKAGDLSKPIKLPRLSVFRKGSNAAADEVPQTHAGQRVELCH